MDEESKERLVVLLTRIGMMAEDLSAIALGLAGHSDEELAALIGEIRKKTLAMKLLGKEAASIAHFDLSGS